MSRDKQMINDLIEIFDEEYDKRNLITPRNTAEKMTAKGYRKSTEVAEEIFAEIDEIFERQIYESRWLDQNGKVLGVVDVFYAFECWRDYIKPELKKKYTEDKNDEM